MGIKPIRPYGKYYQPLTSVFMQCMRLIIGAHSSASGIAVLVRLGVMPLRYMLALRASLWFLKIINGESDDLLSKQWRDLCSDDELLEFTSMYKGCLNFVTRMNEFVDEDIFACSPKKRRDLLSRAIFHELTKY